MNILKYLIAETISDDPAEEQIELNSSVEINHAGIADTVFEAFTALSGGGKQVSSRDNQVKSAVLSDSAIVLNESMFTTGGLTARLDTVH